MKVLITHERYLPDFGGGGEHIVAATATNLAARGIRVRVLTTGDPAIGTNDGIETKRLSINRRRMNLAVSQIAAQARGADLIHTFNYHACLPSLIAGAWLRKPVVCTCLGLFGTAWTSMRGRIPGIVWQSWERFLVNLPYTRILFLSECSRDSALAMGVKAWRAGVSAPAATVDCRPFWPKDDVVLFAGKLERRKGVFDFVEAARALPDIRFRMIGWGPERDRLLRTTPPNLEIGDAQTGAEYAATLGRARIFVLPSHAETFGIAVLEAMASGCAIVSSVPLDFAGGRVQAGDRGALIGQIAALWNSRDECAAMGRRNVALAASYTWERYTDSVLRTYQSIAAERSLAEGGTPVWG